MIERAMTTRLSRRTLTFGLAGAAGMAVAGRVARAGQVAPVPVVTGNSALEPGVQLLIDWRLGMPVLTITELLPPLDWVWYAHPTMPLIFRYPPDWSSVTLWAESYTSGGMPIWLVEQPVMPQLTGVRLVSPTQDAAFEFIGGIIRGQPMTPAQVAVVAKQGALGEDPPLTSICTYEDANPLAPTWFHADYVGTEAPLGADTSILVTSGTAIPLDSLFMPGTNVVYTNLLGPRDEFEGLMRTTFLPILTQFLGGGDDDDDDDDEG